MLHTDIPLNPDFSFIKKDFDIVLTKVYKFVSEKNEWNTIINYNGISFVTSYTNYEKDIVTLMDIIRKEYNISLRDCAFFMHQLKYISQFGHTCYKDYYIKKLIRNI